MGNLTKNTITRGAVVALALSAGAATTANAAVTRTAGADRFSTATEIFKAWPTTTDTAVLAAGIGHDVDALTVAPLAKIKNAPVILVDTTAATADIVAKFSAFKTVYIANGTGVVTPAVEAALTAAGKTVVRLGGATRTETALNIAKAIGTANGIVVANGDDSHIVDTLSIASIAAAKGMPIFLTQGGSLSAAEATYAKGLGAANVYALGGTSVVSDAAATGLGTTVTRLAGADRYSTNAAVVTNFKSDLDLSNIFVASGEDANLIDALAGAPLAGLKNAPIVFAHNSINADVNTLLNGVINKDTNITVIGGVGAVSDAAFTAIQAIQTPVTGTAAVSSVSAIAANAVKVVFTSAPADTTKVVFAVSPTGGNALTGITATWNASNTEAVLTSTAKFAEGSFTVNVKDGVTDLGTSSIAIKAQEVAKITITSSTLAVNAATGNGYISYKVVDQYGVDITNTTLGNDISWTPGIGTLTSAKNGTIVLAPNGVPLTSYTTAVINGYDTDNYVVTSATMTVSQTSGILSDIKLNKLTSPNNDDFNAGNSSGLWYLDFTALDASGNATTDYTLVKAGIQSVNVGSFLTLTAGGNGVDQDPTDSTKAAIPVQINSTNASNLMADTLIPVTILTTGGKTSTLTVTLKKAAALSSFTLSAPSATVSSGNTVILPFTAYDQNGGALTNYNDINGKVSITASTGIQPIVIRNSDGTASIQYTAPTVSLVTTAYIQSNVIATGKSSSLTISVQKPATPDSMTVDTSAGKQFFQTGATLNLDFGYDAAGLSVLDQFGRAIDLTNQNLGVTHYEAIASVTSGNITLSGTASALATAAPASTPIVGYRVYNNNNVVLTAGAAGTSTIKYEIYSVDAAGAIGTDTGIGKTVQYTTLNNSDIASYTLDAVANKIKTVTLSATDGTIGDYAADPTLWGKTSGGVKVRLNPTYIMGASVDSGDFSLSASLPVASVTSSASNDFKVYAKGGFTDVTKTGSSTTLTVVVKDSNNNYQTITTPIASTTSGATVSSIGFSASNKTGLTGLSTTGNTITVAHTNFAQLLARLTKFDTAGVSAGSGAVYFYANDQYGTSDAAINSISVSSQSFAATVLKPVATIVADGTGTGTATLAISNTASIAAGDYLVLTAVSANGKIQTVKILFN
jgi:putative cell wall-binding protein